MFNRLMMGIHWILYGFIILSIFSVILTLVEKGLVDTATEDVFRYSVIALAFLLAQLGSLKNVGYISRGNMIRIGGGC